MRFRVTELTFPGYQSGRTAAPGQGWLDRDTHVQISISGPAPNFDATPRPQTVWRIRAHDPRSDGGRTHLCRYSILAGIPWLQPPSQIFRAAAPHLSQLSPPEPGARRPAYDRCGIPRKRA